MKRLLLPLLAATMLCGAAAPKPGQPPISDHTKDSSRPLTAAQRAVQFEHLDLALEVLPTEKQIKGVATLDFRVTAPLSQIELDLDTNLPVSAVSANGVALDRRQWSNPKGQLRIALPSAIGAGQRLSLRIAYGGTPHVAVKAPWDGGIVWSTTPGGKPYVATAHQLNGCDLLWPCIDHPAAEPVLTDLHITVPRGLSAPANGVLQRVEALADGRRTFHWRAKHLNTYAINLTVAPYDVLRGTYQSRYGNSIPMEFWHLPGRAERARMLFAEFPPTLDFFESVIGPYPFGDEKVGVVETPHKGMEHQTINAYGNDYARDAYGFDWLFHHEFAHEWFANQLTNADADDFWLHEGFGSYMQPLYAEWRGGRMAYMARMFQLRAGLRNCVALVSGQTRTTEQMEGAKTGPGSDVYGKAAWMLHTLRDLIGDKAFFTATRRIVYGRPDPAPGNFRPRFGSSDEFVRIVNEEAGRDHGWFFDVYLRQAQLPHLLAEQRDGRLFLRWKVPANLPFPMPVEVKVGDKVERLAMRGGRGSIAVPQGAHVVLDPDGKLLRRSTDIDALQLWQYEEARKKAKKGDTPPQAPCVAP